MALEEFRTLYARYRVPNFFAVDNIIDMAYLKDLFPALKTIVVAGHSAGGQFVTRMAYYLPANRAKVMAAGNPGWYAMPEWRKDKGADPFPYSLVETGIGGWSEADFVTAMWKGTAPDGSQLPGPQVRWIGRRHGRRKDRRWASAWSPEQIANRLRVDFPDDGSMRISHEAIYQALYVQGRGALRRELTACLRTGRLDRHRRAVQMRIGFDVYRNHLRAGFNKLRGVDTGLRDHQVRIDRQTSELRERLHHRQTNGDVRHEVTVHHIDVQHAGAAAFDCLDLIAETGEVGGQNRRSDLDISLVEHPLASVFTAPVWSWSGWAPAWAEEPPVAG